jgi:hypothetical protein
MIELRDEAAQALRAVERTHGSNHKRPIAKCRL